MISFSGLVRIRPYIFLGIIFHVTGIDMTNHFTQIKAMKTNLLSTSNTERLESD